MPEISVIQQRDVTAQAAGMRTKRQCRPFSLTRPIDTRAELRHPLYLVPTRSMCILNQLRREDFFPLLLSLLPL